MKVGVFLKNFRPEIGGGSTFESEILQSLIKVVIAVIDLPSSVGQRELNRSSLEVI